VSTTKRRKKTRRGIAAPIFEPTPEPPPRQPSWWELAEQKVGCTAADVRAAKDEGQARQLLVAGFETLENAADAYGLKAAAYAADLLKDIEGSFDLGIEISDATTEPTVTLDILGLADFEDITSWDKLREAMILAAGILEKADHLKAGTRLRLRAKRIHPTISIHDIHRTMLAVCMELASDRIIDSVL
jgi:hypothetical protein